MCDWGPEQPHKETGEQHDYGKVQVRRRRKFLENEREKFQERSRQFNETVQEGTFRVAWKNR